MLGSPPVPDAITPQRLDAISDSGRILVFPGPHHDPSRLMQGRVVAPVPGNVRIQLGAPPIGIRPWSHCVVRAAVPEATINEDGDLRTSQCDVRVCRKFCHVHPVPEATAVQLVPQSQLRSCSLSSETRHEATYSWARCLGPLRVSGLGSHR